MGDNIVDRFAARLGYTEHDKERFEEGGHRVRHVHRLAEAAAHSSILAEVIESRHCNSEHTRGQIFILDMDGNFITKHCPGKMCFYLVSQLAIPVALINERLSEGLKPNAFQFMRQVQCLDTGVECMGYGQIRLAISVISRTN